MRDGTEKTQRRFPSHSPRLHLNPAHLNRVVPAGQSSTNHTTDSLFLNRQLSISGSILVGLHFVTSHLCEPGTRGPVGHLPDSNSTGTIVETTDTLVPVDILKASGDGVAGLVDDSSDKEGARAHNNGLADLGGGGGG